MSQPRVLQIGKHFYPDRGGVETVTKNISDALVPTGIQADVLCMALHSTGDLLEDGYRVIRCRSNATVAGNKTLSVEYMRQVGSLSSHYDVGILHVPNPLGAIAALVAWKKPLIVVWHADFRHRLLGMATAAIDIALARRADMVIAPTQIHLSHSNRAHHLRAKAQVIPFPFAPMQVEPGPSPVADAVTRAARGRRVVLAAGRLVPYKGFDVLIRSMMMVGEDLYFVIAGDGPLRASLQQMIAEEGVTDRIMMSGGVGDKDMAALVDLAYFGCLPSVSSQEMYGLTQIEMMARGKPMVSTDLQGSGVPLVNRHGETGLLAKPGDASDLARHLATLGADVELYARLAAGAALAYEREHSLATVGDQYASLIRRLA